MLHEDEVEELVELCESLCELFDMDDGFPGSHVDNMYFGRIYGMLPEDTREVLLRIQFLVLRERDMLDAETFEEWQAREEEEDE